MISSDTFPFRVVDESIFAKPGASVAPTSAQSRRKSISESISTIAIARATPSISSSGIE